MKKIIAILLICVMVLAGCSKSAEQPPSGDNAVSSAQKETEERPQEVVEEDEDSLVENPAPVDSKVPAPEPEFSQLNDPELLDYVEQEVYADVSSQLGDGYRVENVSTTYISKEYLEELAYN